MDGLQTPTPNQKTLLFHLSHHHLCSNEEMIDSPEIRCHVSGVLSNTNNPQHAKSRLIAGLYMLTGTSDVTLVNEPVEICVVDQGVPSQRYEMLVAFQGLESSAVRHPLLEATATESVNPDLCLVLQMLSVTEDGHQTVTMFGGTSIDTQGLALGGEVRGTILLYSCTNEASYTNTMLRRVLNAEADRLVREDVLVQQAHHVKLYVTASHRKTASSSTGGEGGRRHERSSNNTSRNDVVSRSLINTWDRVGRNTACIIVEIGEGDDVDQCSAPPQAYDVSVTLIRGGGTGDGRPLPHCLTDARRSTTSSSGAIHLPRVWCPFPRGEGPTDHGASPWSHHVLTVDNVISTKARNSDILIRVVRGNEEKEEVAQARACAALAIQVWWYKTRGKEDSRMWAKHQLAHTARTFHLLSMNAGPSAGALAIDMVTEVVVGEVQGEVDGRVEEVTANATGDTAGGDIEADTGKVSDLSTVGLGGLSSLRKGATQRFRTLGHRLRILIGYAQITSALVFSFDIPWPPMTLKFLKSLTFINFNFMDFFAPIDPCLLHTPFLKQAAFHMAILPLCAVMIVSASVVAMLRNKVVAKVVWPKAKSTLVTIVFLLYPGIVTRVFTTFKCKKIGDKRYLVADYSVVCGEGDHAAMSAVMLVFAGVYVIGIPLGSILILFCNKKLLAVGDDASPALQKKSEAFAKVFGALYDAYEPRYWWFEAIIMIQKAMLTGGLVLIAPGSSAQVLVGLIIASGFLIVLMQTKPYQEAEEDIMQTIATISTCATLLIGFTLKVDRGASGEQAGEYDDNIIDIILILLFSGVGISGLYMSLKSLPCFAS